MVLLHFRHLPLPFVYQGFPGFGQVAIRQFFSRSRTGDVACFMVARDDEQGILPSAVDSTLFHHGPHCQVEGNLFLDQTACLVVLTRPVHRPSFDHEKKTVRIIIEDIERCQGHFLQGWDVLNRGDSEWISLLIAFPPE